MRMSRGVPPFSEATSGFVNGFMHIGESEIRGCMCDWVIPSYSWVVPDIPVFILRGWLFPNMDSMLGLGPIQHDFRLGPH